MKFFLSPYFQKKYKKLIKNNPKLSQLIDEKFSLFKINSKHSSLRLHKLKGKTVNQWSISIKGDLRIIFQYVKEGILVTNIGSHNEVY